jgi:uncharacterized protein (DUF2249 family)
MYFHSGELYEFKNRPDRIFRCTDALENGWVFKIVSDDYITIANTGFFLYECAEGDVTKHFRERKKTSLDDELFKVAFKVCACGDIDGNLSGSDTNLIHGYEFEHKLFSELWKLPRGEEKKWLEDFDRMDGLYQNFGIAQEQWEEDEDIVGQALCKMRMMKQYFAEMKETANESNTTKADGA